MNGPLSKAIFNNQRASVMIVGQRSYNGQPAITNMIIYIYIQIKIELVRLSGQLAINIWRCNGDVCMGIYIYITIQFIMFIIYIILYYIIFYIILYYIIYHIILYYIKLYFIILYHIISYYIILYYNTILYYIIYMLLLFILSYIIINFGLCTSIVPQLC